MKPAYFWSLLISVGFSTAALCAGDDPPANLADYERPFKLAEREHWAFQPVRRPAVPSFPSEGGVRGDWIQTPIDAFVLARLKDVGLDPAPPAERRTLLRRVYLDLIGVPPTPDEQRRFLMDESPDALAKVVDDLLARPQYGERWGRHWLDLARYAETNGYERDGAKPHAWRYRDYVIDSFNRDKPFDRFLTEQLAGDEIDGSNAESQIATTFMRLGTWDDEPADPLPDRYDQLDDVLGTTATAFLGLTVRCARCHYHKFEPFSQVDYYRLLAVFEPLKRPEVVVSATHRKEHELHVGTEAELAAFRDATAKADAEVAAVQTQLDELKKTIRDRLFAAPPNAKPARASESPLPSGERGRVEGSPDDAQPEPKRTSLPPEAVAAFQADPAERTNEQKELVKKFTDKLEQEIREAATDSEQSQRADCEKRIGAISAARPKELPKAHIWYEDSPQAAPTRLFRRGDVRTPVGEVGPGLPAIVAARQLQAPKPATKSTGRRLWLANWMTSPDNPLVARVIVNRIWQHHFGEGLVASENDFGVMGDRPSHPELLDWLAAEFVATGWKLKPLHRMIALSSTYQQSSLAAGRGPDVDPDNRRLWHWPQRRVAAEVVRDSMLAASGQLNPQMAGPSVYPPLPRAVLEGQSRPGEGWGKSDEHEAARRSIYIYVKRVLAVPELELMDAPDTTSSCEQRPVSTVAPQALTFLNGEFTNQQARHFAARLRREAGPEPRSQLELAFELALCRSPRPEELQAAIDFLAAQQRQIEADSRALNKEPGDVSSKALAAFCLVLLNTNEFVYVN